MTIVSCSLRLVVSALVSVVVGTGCKTSSPAVDPEAELPRGEFPEQAEDAPAIRPLDPKVAEAEELIAKGQIQDALDQMEMALMDDPDNADFHYGRGSALSYLERDDDALAAYDRALEIDAEHVPALVARGNLVAFGFGQLEEAEADFARAVELAPRFQPALHGLGVVQFDLRMIDEAIGSLSAALALDAAAVDTLFVLAQAYAAKGETDSAIEHIRSAIELEAAETSVDLRLVLARLLLAKGERDGAVEQFEMAASLAPDAPDLRLAVARGLLQAGSPDKALVHVEAVAATLPDQPPVLVNWGRVLAALDRTDEALAKCDAALEKNPASPAANAYKIETLARMSKCKDAGKALVAFEKTAPKEDVLARAQAAVEGCT